MRCQLEETAFIRTPRMSEAKCQGSNRLIRAPYRTFGRAWSIFEDVDAAAADKRDRSTSLHRDHPERDSDTGFSTSFNDSSMPPIGQTSTHAPQTLQKTWLMWYVFAMNQFGGPSSEIASKGHASAHRPQPTQASELI